MIPVGSFCGTHPKSRVVEFAEPIGNHPEWVEVGRFLPWRQRSRAVDKSNPRSAAAACTRCALDIDDLTVDLLHDLYRDGVRKPCGRARGGQPQRVLSDQNAADPTGKPLVTALRANLVRAGGTSQV